MADFNSTPSARAPDSWQWKQATQQPVYRDCESLEKVIAQLEKLPLLVTSWEVEALKIQLGEAVRGERFLLQGGDCAESFGECKPEAIINKINVDFFTSHEGLHLLYEQAQTTSPS